MKGTKKGLLLLLLTLGIGFASIATILTVTGTVNVKPDESGFQNDVKFTSVSVDETSATAGTTVTAGQTSATDTLVISMKKSYVGDANNAYTFSCTLGAETSEG